MEKIVENIKSVAEARLKEEDLKDCFLVDIRLNGQKIEVFIDADKGVHFGQCQKLSRGIEAYLDESNLMGPKYTLQVSSPGVDRPLTMERQYPKHLGRKIEVSLLDGSLISGKLSAVNKESITVTTAKTKKKDSKSLELRYDTIKQSKILITF